MTSSKKTGLALATFALSAYLGIGTSVADDIAVGDQKVTNIQAEWPGLAAPRWGFPPVEAGSEFTVRAPKTTEQQFAAYRDGSWPGSQESKWGYAHGAGQGTSVKVLSADEQWAAAETDNWPGKAEARWGQAHVPNSDDATPNRQAAVDSK